VHGVTELEAGGPVPGSARGAGTTVHLVAPAGWAVRRVAGAGPATATWPVTPAASASPGEATALCAYATTGPSGSAGPSRVVAYGRVPATVACSPTAYTSQIDDHFAAGDLPSYSQLQSVVTGGTGEVAPTWTAGGGEATAAAAQPWFGFLVSGAAPASPEPTAVVNVKALDSGATNHNSGVFVGRSTVTP
jgi:hypothetical protein